MAGLAQTLARCREVRHAEVLSVANQDHTLSAYLAPWLLLI
jgi:hypothetical protein